MSVSLRKPCFPTRVLVLGLVLLVATATTGASAADPAQDTVSLTIDFNDGCQLRFTRLAWSDEMTALDSLAAAEKHARGVKYKVRGTGAIAFVTELDSLANEGGNGRNWMFKVNGKISKVGAGSQEIEPGDHVEWLFVRYEDLK